jgi:ribosomal protein S18 acetylase RimI-like enzyme
LECVCGCVGWQSPGKYKTAYSVVEESALGKEPRQNQALTGLTRPGPLDLRHIVESFQCGQPPLDDWLKKRALMATDGGTARTIVVCRENLRVVGYFSLAAGSVEHESAPGALKRNAPDPIPVIILARLAIAIEDQSKGLGSALLAEAMKRTVKASNIIGARALIVHALDSKAANFYRSHGFQPLSGETYFIPVKAIVRGL